MRGNHRMLGRNDYVEPLPLDGTERALVESCTVVKRDGSKFWCDVYRFGKLLGGVAIYMSGQVYKPIGVEPGEYLLAAMDWNSSDPKYASAILHMLRYDPVSEPAKTA